SEEQNPTWAFEEGGTYSVKLTIGCYKGTDEFLSENLITVADAMQPDLTVLAPESPESVEAGSIAPVSCIVKNSGNGISGPSVLKICLSSDTALDQSDIELNAADIPGLISGEQKPILTDVSIPHGISAGTWYVLFKADAGEQVSEINETNNLGYHQTKISIVNPPYLKLGEEEGAPGTTVSVPLILSNDSDLAVESVNIVFDYEDSVVTPISAGLCGVLDSENYAINVNTDLPGRASLVIYAAGAVHTNVGIANIACIEFNVIGNVGEFSNLEFTDADVNEQAPAGTIDGLITVNGGYTLNGKVRYFSNEGPVRHVTMSLEGANSYSEITDSDGTYGLADALPGDYVLTAEKTDDLGGLSGTDASRIARNSIGLYAFTCHEMITGDVTGNGRITGLDASRVARYAAGLLDCLNAECRNWMFTPEPINTCDTWPPISYPSSREFKPLNTSLTDKDFIAFRIGDVTGNWNINLTRNASRLSRGTTTETIWSDKGKSLSIPVYLNQSIAIEGLDFTVVFDEKILDAQGADLTGTILEGQNYGIQLNTNTDGQMTVVLSANSQPFTGSGIVAFLNFGIVGSFESSATLAFSKFEPNETAIGGKFYVNETQADQVMVNVNSPDLDYVIRVLKLITGDEKTGLDVSWDVTEDKKIDVKDAIYGIRDVAGFND
ncbi:MAG: CARDB domain-containing protein, partial [Desulfobacterales bacterium]